MQANEPGYDPKCGGPDAPDRALNAPAPGRWFHHDFVALATKPVPPR